MTDRNIRITGAALNHYDPDRETFDSVCPDCEFCQGRAARTAGEPKAANPYPNTGGRFTGSLEANDLEPAPWYLWNLGWESG